MGCRSEKEKGPYYEDYLQFLAYQELLGRSSQTIVGFRTTVPRLLDYMDRWNLSPLSMGLSQARDYQKSLLDYRTAKGSPYSPWTVYSLLYGAVSFFDYLKNENKIPGNPFKSLRRPSREKPLPKQILKEKEMNRFLEHISHFEGKPLREASDLYRAHVVAELMYSTGIRIGEAAALECDDILLDRSLVLIRKGKGNRERKAFLNDYAKEVLRIYLQEMREWVLTEQHNKTLLFGTRDLVNFLNKRLHVLAAELEFSPFSSHVFRHCVGYHFLRAGCQIRYIQEILGHKHIASTEVYTRVDKENLKAILDQYHPRRWKSHDTE